MNRDLWVGIVLSILAGLALLALVLWGLWYRKEAGKPLYQKNIPKITYEKRCREMLWTNLKNAYSITGTVDGMLAVAVKKCQDKMIRKRLLAARSYLKESPYKDFETALFTYVSDGSEEMQELLEEILSMEVRKRRGLPLKLPDIR